MTSELRRRRNAVVEPLELNGGAVLLAEPAPLTARPFRAVCNGTISILFTAVPLPEVVHPRSVFGHDHYATRTCTLSGAVYVFSYSTISQHEPVNSAGEHFAHLIGLRNREVRGTCYLYPYHSCPSS